MRLKKSSKHGFVGPLACAMALGFTGFSVIYPQFGSAYAVGDVTKAQDGTVQVEVKEVFGSNVPDATGTGNGQIEVNVENPALTGDATDSKTETITVTVEEFLQITIPNAGEGTTADVAMEADPTKDGVTTRNSADFTVAGNNRNGFGVFVYAASDPNLSSAVAANEFKVAPIDGQGIKLNDFGVNKWGYNVTKADAAESTIDAYNAIDVRANTTSAAYTVNKPSAGENLKLNCGAKVDTKIPADTYKTGVVISAVAPATNWAP